MRADTLRVILDSEHTVWSLTAEVVRDCWLQAPREYSISFRDACGIGKMDLSAEKSVTSCYQVLNLKTHELLVSCPQCKQVSKAPPDAIVACPKCDQHLYTEPTAGRFLAPVMANPKDVQEISAIMPHLSLYHIAATLDEQNYNKRAAVLSLLAGKSTQETDAWLATNSDNVSTLNLPLAAPVSQVYVSYGRLGFDDSLGKWNADHKYSSDVNMERTAVVQPPKVKPRTVTKPVTCASKTAFYDRKMGFDNSLGLWNVDSKYFF